jgi:hypothetical protein
LLLFRRRRFARGDAFVGYQKDTPAAVVFQASNFLRRLREEDDETVIHSKLEVLDRAGILEIVPLNVLLDREEITELWKEAVCHFLNFIYYEIDKLSRLGAASQPIPPLTNSCPRRHRSSTKHSSRGAEGN